MEIQIPGRKSATKSLIEVGVKFLAKELKLERSTYRLDIITDPGMSTKDGIRGVVHKMGPKYLVMIIDSKLDYERLLVTLSHEMVHVKQYAKGQVKASRSCKTHYWMGKQVRKGYYEQPWEIEAYSKERVLANKMFAIINKGKPNGSKK